MNTCVRLQLQGESPDDGQRLHPREAAPLVHITSFAWKYCIIISAGIIFLATSSSTISAKSYRRGKHDAEHSSIPQGAVIFIKEIEPRLGRTRELQLHEMHPLVVRRIINPPQLIDLIESAIHVRVPTLRIEQLKSSAPARRSPYRSRTAEPRLLPWYPPELLAPEFPYFARLPPPGRRTPAARRVFLTYSSTPCMMETPCFSITLWLACTIPELTNRGPLTQGRAKRGVGARRAHLHARFIFRTAAVECSKSSVSFLTADTMAVWASP